MFLLIYSQDMTVSRVVLAQNLTIAVIIYHDLPRNKCVRFVEQEKKFTKNDYDELKMKIITRGNSIVRKLRVIIINRL